MIRATAATKAPVGIVVPAWVPAGAVFWDDFETGDFSKWSSEVDASSQLAISASAADEGTYGARLINTTRDDAYLTRSFTIGTTVEFGFSMRFSSDWTTGGNPGQIEIARLTAAGARRASIYLRSGDKKINQVDWTQFNAVQSAELSHSTWYDVVFAVSGVGTSGAVLTTTIDSVLECNRTGSNWSSVTGIDGVRMVQTLDQPWNTAAGTVDFDKAWVTSA